jgi:hypothetical protein
MTAMETTCSSGPVRWVWRASSRTESALRNQYMTPAEALLIAEQIAKLPDWPWVIKQANAL